SPVNWMVRSKVGKVRKPRLTVKTERFSFALPSAPDLDGDPMTSRVPKQPDLPPAKREQILQGAKALFRELGFERASVDAIAAEAGVSKATIYNHFRSKEALFLSAYGAETARVRE